MSLKKKINDIKKNYSLGIIGGGQLALMLTEAAKKRDLEVCVQTKSCDDPAGSKADHVIEADPLKIRGNKSCLLYTSPSPRDRSLSRMPSSA